MLPLQEFPIFSRQICGSFGPKETFRLEEYVDQHSHLCLDHMLTTRGHDEGYPLQCLHYGTVVLWVDLDTRTPFSQLRLLVALLSPCVGKAAKRSFGVRLCMHGLDISRDGEVKVFGWRREKGRVGDIFQTPSYDKLL